MSGKRKRITETALMPPAGLDPDWALYGAQEQFIFVARKGGLRLSKAVSPGAVRQAFASQPVDSGWLPSGVARWGSSAAGEWMLRWHPPQIYRVWFDDLKRPLNVPMPALVFIGIGNAYYLWAMRGATFDPKAKLCHAPCANVNSIGLICWGSNAHPPVTAKNFDQMWKLFWEAPFNNNWSDGKSAGLIPKSTTINKLLKRLGRQKAAAYPEQDLVAGTWTLNQAVEKMAARGGRD